MIPFKTPEISRSWPFEHSIGALQLNCLGSKLTTICSWPTNVWLVPFANNPAEILHHWGVQKNPKPFCNRESPKLSCFFPLSFGKTDWCWIVGWQASKLNIGTVGGSCDRHEADDKLSTAVSLNCIWASSRNTLLLHFKVTETTQTRIWII